MLLSILICRFTGQKTYVVVPNFVKAEIVVNGIEE